LASTSYEKTASFKQLPFINLMSMKNFQILAKIGEGSYSVVYRVRRLSDNQEYALKKVCMGNLSAKEKENSVNEVRILASFE
jgi:NIMA (never in mitosis gene a)-related kinase